MIAKIVLKIVKNSFGIKCFWNSLKLVKNKSNGRIHDDKPWVLPFCHPFIQSIKIKNFIIFANFCKNLIIFFLLIQCSNLTLKIWYDATLLNITIFTRLHFLRIFLLILPFPSHNTKHATWTKNIFRKLFLFNFVMLRLLFKV